jgi:hypothetical protein
MGCYICNSPEGSEAKLCPVCRDRKLKHNEYTENAMQTSLIRARDMTFVDFLESTTGKIFFVGGIIAFMAFHYLAAPWGPQIMMPVGTRVYSACIKDAKSRAGDSFDQDRVTWETACDGFKSTCDLDPSSASCSSIRERFGI